MKIIENNPIFGLDSSETPALEYRANLPGFGLVLSEFGRRGIKPDAVITQDDGQIINCWMCQNHIIAERRSPGHWIVGQAYLNTVSPNMIPADLDSKELEISAGFPEVKRISGMISISEWASLHGHKKESANKLIQRGKLPQAQKIGRNWILPEDTPWPEDRRYKSHDVV